MSSSQTSYGVHNEYRSVQSIEYRPKAPLDVFVDKIWYFKSDVFDSHGITFPILQHELIFSFSDLFSLKKNNDETFNNQTCWLSGLQTQPIQSITNGSHESLGVFFKPWGLQPFINISMTELTDQQIDLALILGCQGKHLTEQIFDAETAEEKTRIVEEFLVTRLSDKMPPYDILKSVKYLQNNEFKKGSIKTIAACENISTKSLIRRFKSTIGLSPGKFAHLIRLNNILTGISDAPGQPLIRIAYDNFFYDQAHFNHFFKSYTGLTPRQYQRSVQSKRVDSEFPNYLHATL